MFIFITYSYKKEVFQLEKKKKNSRSISNFEPKHVQHR